MRLIRVLAALTVLGVTPGVLGQPGPVDTAPGRPPEKLLRDLYAEYNSALLRKDGAAVASMLHSNIARTYGEALQLAHNASREELLSVPAHKKLIVLYIRAASSPQELAALRTSSDVIAFMVRKGALGSDAQMSTDVRNLEYDGEAVRAELYANGRSTNLRLRFAREEGAWKIDLADLNAMADDVYAQGARMQKVSQDEALLRLIQVSLGRTVGEDVWMPLNGSPGARR